MKFLKSFGFVLALSVLSPVASAQVFCSRYGYPQTFTSVYFYGHYVGSCHSYDPVCIGLCSYSYNYVPNYYFPYIPFSYLAQIRSQALLSCQAQYLTCALNPWAWNGRYCDSQYYSCLHYVP